MIRDVEQVAVSILGESFTFVTDEGRKSVDDSARRVDMLMHEIAAKMRTPDPRRVAILAALRLAHELGAAEQRFVSQQQHLVDVIDRELASLSP